MSATPRRRPSPAVRACCGLTLLALVAGGPVAVAQTSLSTAPGLTEATRAKLDARVSLTLRGTPLADALMTVREAAGLNLVIGAELQGTVDVAFRDAPVHQVLDTLLLARGLGYRPVGDGLVVVPAAELGASNPLIETAVIPTPAVDPQELLTIVEGMLSPEGRAHALQAGQALVVFDYPGRLAAVRAQVGSLDAAAAAAGRAKSARAAEAAAAASAGPGAVPEPVTDVRVFTLNFVAPTDIAAAIAPLLGPDGRAAPLDNESRLVVSDVPPRLAAIGRAIAQLDLPREQVRIRAMIYDCAVEDSRRLGLNWNGGLRGRSFDAAGNALQDLTFAGVTAATGSPAVGAAGLAGGQIAANSLGRYGDLGATLNALNQSKDSRLLADPNVVALNHEEAVIKIVTEVPYQQLTQGIQGGAIGTTEFREAGVTLNVVPHIAPDRSVTMVVSPEFSVLTGFTPEQNAPIIDTREATTTVRIRDRETLVLGGLRQRSRTRNGTSLPGFGDVPLVGRLFRHKNFEVRESELLVFLTPEIVDCGYAGDCREIAVLNASRVELEQTPVYPAPMGLEAALAEDRARDGLPWWDRPRGRRNRRRRVVIDASGEPVACVNGDGSVCGPECGELGGYGDAGLIAPGPVPQPLFPAPGEVGLPAAAPPAFPTAPPAPAPAAGAGPSDLIDPF